MQRQYRVGELAALTGVSIRTLHHYDRIRLLRPATRSESGYRLYSGQELLRLQQILTLRYLGFELSEIRELLEQPDFSLVASLHLQQAELGRRLSELDRIRSVLGDLLQSRLATGRWDWPLVVRASAAVQGGLAQKGDGMKERYTPEQMKQWEQLAREVPSEVRLVVEQGWAALLGDLHAVRDQLDAASPAARALADRWDELTAHTVRAFRGRPRSCATRWPRTTVRIGSRTSRARLARRISPSFSG